MKALSDWQRSLIKKEAEKIKSEIQGGQLFGIPIDLEDANQLILASFYYGKVKERLDNLSTIEPSGILQGIEMLDGRH
jgi:hypothetical protein